MLITYYMRCLSGQPALPKYNELLLSTGVSGELYYGGNPERTTIGNISKLRELCTSLTNGFLQIILGTNSKTLRIWLQIFIPSSQGFLQRINDCLTGSKHGLHITQQTYTCSVCRDKSTYVKGEQEQACCPQALVCVFVQMWALCSMWLQSLPIGSVSMVDVHIFVGKIGGAVHLVMSRQQSKVEFWNLPLQNVVSFE